MKANFKYLILLVILTVLTPIGIIIPKLFNAGSAYGEWGADELNSMLGFVPKGLSKFSNIWNGFFPDYSFRGISADNAVLNSVFYITSGFIGLAVCMFAVFIILKLICKNNKSAKA